jgi:hypothetical protein
MDGDVRYAFALRISTAGTRRFTVCERNQRSVGRRQVGRRCYWESLRKDGTCSNSGVSHGTARSAEANAAMDVGNVASE